MVSQSGISLLLVPEIANFYRFALHEDQGLPTLCRKLCLEFDSKEPVTETTLHTVL
jgi:hypothetical protein